MTRAGSQSVTIGHGRMTSYARSGEVSLTHAYNGNDDRISTTTSSAATATPDTRRFIYAPDGRVIGEYGSSSSDVRAEFIWLSPQVGDAGSFGGDDGLDGYMPLAVAANDNGTQLLAYVQANHMGVPAVYTDATGAAINAPSGYSAPGFPGQSRTLADLYYNRHRDYDPSTGRYIQADPIGLDGGASPYSYAMNNPLRYTDPTGENPVALGRAVVGGGRVVGTGLTWWCRRNMALCMRTIGPAAIRMFNACKAVAKAVGGGNDGDNCTILVQKITEARNELAKRVKEYRDNVHRLPSGPGPMTRSGHRHQFQGWQRRLRLLLNDAMAKGCKGYPSDSWYFASKVL